MIRISFLAALVMFALAVPSSAELAVRGTVDHGGQTREHYVYVPPDADQSTPLIIALHGMGGNAANLRFGLGLTEAAARHGFAVVYPQGVRLPQGSRHWNAGFDVMQIDDLGYLSHLARHLQRTHGLAGDRVMVLGISLGGFMGYHLACQSDLPIVALVSVAGNLPSANWPNCTPSQGVSLLHIHGARDRVIRLDGTGGWISRWGPSPQVRDVVKFWARATDSTPVKAQQLGHIENIRYSNSQSGVEVQLTLLKSLGHDWPGQKVPGFRTLDKVMEFFSRHDGRGPAPR